MEIFISAAHMNSLGLSAAFHHLSQSAASAAIQRVEAAFGTALCTHEKRRFRLTQRGSSLLSKMEELVAQLHNLVVPKHELKVITSDSLARIAIPCLFSIQGIDFNLLPSDKMHPAFLHNQSNIGLVLDTSIWTGVVTNIIGSGYFQLYCRDKDVPSKPILVSENGEEVLALQRRSREVNGIPLSVHLRIPSWWLIGEICSNSLEVGFIPDFVGKTFQLSPVKWQPAKFEYHILIIYIKAQKELSDKFDLIVSKLRTAFSQI